MGHIKISVIIPIYNVELYIKRCAESTLNQNLSKDEYEVIFDDITKKDLKIKYIDFNEYDKISPLWVDLQNYLN